MLLLAQPEYLARRFSSSRHKRGRPPKRPIDDGDDDHNEVDNNDLMRPADDGVLKAREGSEERWNGTKVSFRSNHEE